MARPPYLRAPPGEPPSSTGSASDVPTAPPPFVQHGRESLSPFAAGRDAPGGPRSPLGPTLPPPGAEPLSPPRPPPAMPPADMRPTALRRPMQPAAAAALAVPVQMEQARAEAIKRALALRALFPSRRR